MHLSQLRFASNKPGVLTAWALLLAMLLSVGSCRAKSAAEEKPVALTTIEPLRFFMNRLAGEAIHVDAMVPAGSSPATYSPAPAQMKILAESKLYIQAGHLGFELAWMEKMQRLNPDMKVVNLSEPLTLIRGRDIDHGDHVHVGGVDPHIWMSPEQVQIFLPLLKQALIENWPQLTDTIQANFELLMEEVLQRHNQLKELTASLTHRKFMIFHPALSYLARDYGLEQLPIEFEGKEPSPGGLKRVIDRALSEEIRVIFIQEEFDKRNAQLVSGSTGAQLVVINPLRYNWLEEMDYIAGLLEEYLK